MNFRKKKKEKKEKDGKKSNILSKLLTTLCCCFAFALPKEDEEKEINNNPSKKCGKRLKGIPQSATTRFQEDFRSLPEIDSVDFGPPLSRARSESHLNKAATSSEKKKCTTSNSASNLHLAKSRQSFLWPIKSFIRASFHQGSEHRLRSPFIGNQCTVMALTAVTHSVFQPVASWSRSIVEFILMEGNRNHCTIMANLGRTDRGSPRIGLHEIENRPVPIQLGDKFHIMMSSMASSAWGLVSAEGPDHVTAEDGGYVPLNLGLLRSLEGVDGAVFTVGEYSLAVIKDRGGYKMWDSHSRNAYGLSTENGGAIVVGFDHLNDLVTLIRRQVKQSGKKEVPFESLGFKLVD